MVWNYQEVTELHATHPILVYADDVNIFGKNINTTKKSTEALLVVTIEAVLEVNARQNHNLLTSNKSKLHS